MSLTVKSIDWVQRPSQGSADSVEMQSDIPSRRQPQIGQSIELAEKEYAKLRRLEDKPPSKDVAGQLLAYEGFAYADPLALMSGIGNAGIGWQETVAWSISAAEQRCGRQDPAGQYVARSVAKGRSGTRSRYVGVSRSGRGTPVVGLSQFVAVDRS